MPAKSKKQQRTMRWALSYKKGKVKKAPSFIKKIASGMSFNQLKHFSKLKEEVENLINKNSLDKINLKVLSEIVKFLKKRNYQIEYGCKNGWCHITIYNKQEGSRFFISFQIKKDSSNYIINCNTRYYDLGIESKLDFGNNYGGIFSNLKDFKNYLLNMFTNYEDGMSLKSFLLKDNENSFSFKPFEFEVGDFGYYDKFM